MMQLEVPWEKRARSNFSKQGHSNKPSPLYPQVSYIYTRIYRRIHTYFQLTHTSNAANLVFCSCFYPKVKMKIWLMAGREQL